MGLLKVILTDTNIGNAVKSFGISEVNKKLTASLQFLLMEKQKYLFKKMFVTFQHFICNIHYISKISIQGTTIFGYKETLLKINNHFPAYAAITPKPFKFIPTINSAIPSFKGKLDKFIAEFCLCVV